MELTDIKKGFFGFNKNSVYEYISELNRICAEKTEEAHKEKNAATSALNRKNEELNGKISALEVEIDNLKKQLLEKDETICALQEENEKLKSDTDARKALEKEVADILADARGFAQSVRERTISENEELMQKNRRAYNAERQRLKEYGKNISKVKELITVVLEHTKNELCAAEEEIAELEGKSNE